MEPTIFPITDVGRERTRNEDSVRAQPLADGSQVLLVCDGMGGHEAGDVASRIAADAILGYLEEHSGDPSPGLVLHRAFQEANRAVREEAERLGKASMGTTAVVAWLRGDGCQVGWVGDSRLYRFRPGCLTVRTLDHTRVREMYRHGILTREEMKNHPDAHILVRAIGGGAGVQQAEFNPEVWQDPLDLSEGDVLLLCSDGLYDLIPDEEIYGVIAGWDCERAAQRLVALANERGGYDNITVVLATMGVLDVPADPPSGFEDDAPGPTPPGLAPVIASTPDPAPGPDFPALPERVQFPSPPYGTEEIVAGEDEFPLPVLPSDGPPLGPAPAEPASPLPDTSAPPVPQPIRAARPVARPPRPPTPSGGRQDTWDDPWADTCQDGPRGPHLSWLVAAGIAVMLLALGFAAGWLAQGMLQHRLAAQRASPPRQDLPIMEAVERRYEEGTAAEPTVMVPPSAVDAPPAEPAAGVASEPAAAPIPEAAGEGPGAGKPPPTGRP